MEVFNEQGDEDLPVVDAPGGENSSVGTEQLEHVLVREAFDDTASPSLDVRRRPEGVQHGFLRRLDRGGEDLVDHVAIDGFGRAPSGEGDEDLAAPMMGDRACASEAEPGTAGYAPETMCRQWNIRRHDDDAAATAGNSFPPTEDFSDRNSVDA
jgi:hypothetical protein